MVKLYKYYLLFVILNYVSAHRMLEESTNPPILPKGEHRINVCLNKNDDDKHYVHEKFKAAPKKTMFIHGYGFDMYSYQRTLKNGDFRYPFYCKNRTDHSYSLWNINDAEDQKYSLEINKRIRFINIRFCRTKHRYANESCEAITNSSYTAWVKNTPNEICKYLYEDHVWAFCFSNLVVIAGGKTVNETIEQMIVDEIVFNSFNVMMHLKKLKKWITFKMMRIRTQLRLYDFEYDENSTTFTNLIVAGERRSYFCDSYEFVNSTQNVTIRFKEMRFQARTPNQVGPYFRFGPIGFGCSKEHQCKHCMGLRLPYWIIRLFWNYKLLWKRFLIVKTKIPTNYTDLYE